MPKARLENPQSSLRFSKKQLLSDLCYSLLIEPTNSSNFTANVKPFTLNDYGTEKAEHAELKRRLGWPSVHEIGKFYDHKGSDTWYYYVYGPPPSYNVDTLVKNEAATLCCGRTIYGDVAVVRSGPIDSK